MHVALEHGQQPVAGCTIVQPKFVGRHVALEHGQQRMN